jgi:uncharacterized membrane protein
VQRAAFGLFAALSVGVAAYALVAYSVLPIGASVHPDMRASFEVHRIGIYTHVFCAALALLLGPLQFSRVLRTARPALHRWTGRIYLGVGVGVGGVSGLYAAAFAYGGLVSTAGFGLLALVWLYTGARAWQAVRARDFVAHREWMLRNYALSLAAVTLRVYLGIALAAGLPFEMVYPALAWLSWIPNIIAAGIILQRTR